MGRVVEALEAWESLACGPGRTAIVAAIEAAKLREHRLADAGGALATVERGLHLADRRRALGMPDPALEADLRHRQRRLLVRAQTREQRRLAVRPDEMASRDVTSPARIHQQRQLDTAPGDSDRAARMEATT